MFEPIAGRQRLKMFELIAILFMAHRLRHCRTMG
jgi:hypothetical protein